MGVKSQEAVDYFQWLSENGGKGINEEGIQVIITDKLLKEGKEWGELAAKAMMRFMAHDIFFKGRKPTKSFIELECDPCYRAHELNLIVESIFEGTPEQYMMMCYISWKNEQLERKRLERLSIWGHICQWFKWKRACQNNDDNIAE